MLNRTTAPLRPRVLVVDDELAKLDTALGRAVESLAAALEARNIDVLKAISFEDGQAIVVSDASLRAVLLDWNLGMNSEGSHAQATALLHKFRERHETAPVFLIADRERTRGTMTVEVAEMVDEFVLPLEDSADFIAGRVMAAIRRYEAQLLPPYARMLAEYARLREHSWSAPGHQGGIAFTKLPAGRAFFDFLGENTFRTLRRECLDQVVILQRDAPAANSFRLCGVLQSSAHALGITERRALASSGPTLWRHPRHSDPGWTAPPIRPDMIFGKDNCFKACHQDGRWFGSGFDSDQAAHAVS